MKRPSIMNYDFLLNIKLRSHPRLLCVLRGALLWRVAEGYSDATEDALCILEKILQAELDQPRCHRGLGNDAEVCRSQSRAGIAELRVVQRIVEFHAQRNCCFFPEASHSRRLAK